MSDFTTTYTDALRAFDLLTGKMDKDALKAQLRDGLVAVAAAADGGLSIRQIEEKTGVSKSKVERDIRAGRILASHAKASPVVVKQACDVLTATEVAKAMQDPKPIAALSRAKDAKLAGKAAPKAPAVEDEQEEEGAAAPAKVKTPATPDEQALAALAILAPLAKSDGVVTEKVALALAQVVKAITSKALAGQKAA